MALLRAFKAYIKATEIPVEAEFVYQHDIYKRRLYDWPEFEHALALFRCKKEAVLERKALGGEINVTVAIFSLKQMGWSDRLEQTNKDAKMSPEDMCAHLETLGTNLEALLVRKKDQLQGNTESPAAPAPRFMVSSTRPPSKARTRQRPPRAPRWRPPAGEKLRLRPTGRNGASRGCETLGTTEFKHTLGREASTATQDSANPIDFDLERGHYGRRPVGESWR